MKIIDGGVTKPKGFMAAGEHVGVKKRKRDLAIIYTELPAVYAGTFTTNVVKAASVLWNMERFNNGNKIQAVVVNSGNANACTGKVGIEHNALMAETTANTLGINTEDVLVASTGVIGSLLPIEKIVTGIQEVGKTLENTEKKAKDAAIAILTTDTQTKEIAVTFEIGGKKAVMAAMGKGSGMIHPNMATMLSFITTDVAISKELLDKALKKDVDETYNMISVDGDTSTNDMVIALANGACGNDMITDEGKDYNTFKEALHIINTFMAKAIINDGEGVTKVLEVHVTGAHTLSDAKKLAKSIITSNLVKTAFFGEDANWGRVLCAMGYSGADFDPNHVSLVYESKKGSIQLLQDGLPIVFDEKQAADILSERNIILNVVVGNSEFSATAWGCDLSYDYVKINGDYRT